MLSLTKIIRVLMLVPAVVSFNAIAASYTYFKAIPGLQVTGSSSSTLNYAQLPLAFGSIALGTHALAQSVHLTNSGTGTVSLASISLTQANGFTQQHNCGSSLAVGASCTVTVNFEARIAGLTRNVLQVASNASATPMEVALSGMGVDMANALTLAPGILSFGWVPVGMTGTATVTLHNTASLSGALLIGTPTVPFTRVSTTCPDVLAPGNSCNIVLGLTPMAVQAALSSISIAFGPNAHSSNLVLQGDGAIPTFTQGGLTWAAPQDMYWNSYDTQIPCQGLSINGAGGWRLPTLVEMQSARNVKGLPFLTTQGWTDKYLWSSNTADATTVYAYDVANNVTRTRQRGVEAPGVCVK
ncbi:MAG: choice-of-anchor D domain-containing protein [Agitococcus sp.]|nr:choice-of-anchor D domain-containing protein [Agitococcus sp.]MDO9179149.1 choice-of-anchor D domain-containing protein [Agitococcus sp.]